MGYTIADVSKKVSDQGLSPRSSDADISSKISMGETFTFGEDNRTLKNAEKLMNQSFGGHGSQALKFLEDASKTNLKNQDFNALVESGTAAKLIDLKNKNPAAFDKVASGQYGDMNALNKAIDDANKPAPVVISRADPKPKTAPVSTPAAPHSSAPAASKGDDDVKVATKMPPAATPKKPDEPVVVAQGPKTKEGPAASTDSGRTPPIFKPGTDAPVKIGPFDVGQIDLGKIMRDPGMSIPGNGNISQIGKKIEDFLQQGGTVSMGNAPDMARKVMDGFGIKDATIGFTNGAAGPTLEASVNLQLNVPKF